MLTADQLNQVTELAAALMPVGDIATIIGADPAMLKESIAREQTPEALAYRTGQLKNKAEFNKGVSRILSDSLKKNKSSDAAFEIESTTTKTNVVLVNCVYNSEKLIRSALSRAEDIYKERDLIIVIPIKYKHLIAFDVAEIWLVETKSKNKFYVINGFDQFVNEQFARFEKVYLSPIDIVEDLRLNFSTKLFLYFKNFSNN